MKTIIIIAIIIVSTLSAVFIFSAIPSDIWKDQRTDFTGVSPPEELDEKIDCLSKGGVWDYTSCNFEEPEPELKIPLDIAIKNIKDAILANASYEELLNIIKNEVDENNLGQFSALAIKNLKEEFEDGEKITFDLVAFGYRDWCLMPQISLYYQNYEEPIYQVPISHPCPAPAENPGPRVSYFTETHFGLFPTCKFPGIHTIKGELFEYGPEKLAEFYCKGQDKFQPPQIYEVIIPLGATDPEVKANFIPSEISIRQGDTIRFVNNDNVTLRVLGDSERTNDDGVEFYYTLKPGEVAEAKVVYHGDHTLFVDIDDKVIPWLNATIYVD